MQHIYAVLFAGSITLLLAVIILYFDYGFWRDKYSRSDVITEEGAAHIPNGVEVQSPGKLIGSFLEEASVRFKELNSSKSTLLDGKEVYSKDKSTTSEDLKAEYIQN